MQTTAISEDMLKRRILVGCVSDPNKACRLVGLFPMSEEQQEREEFDAMRRLESIESVTPVLLHIGEWIAEATTALQMDGAGIDPESPFAQRFEEMVQSAVLAGLFTGVANLVDLGYLRVGE